MRIGLNGGGATVDQMIEQAQRAEADGFTSLWYPGAVAGDPLVPMSHVGRATSTIELGTSVLPTYPCHPVLMAGRATSAANAMGRPGLTLGIGPSHAPVVDGMYGIAYDHPGRHTEEYVGVVAQLLRGEAVDFDGDEFRVRTRAAAPEPGPIPLVVAALATRLLRVAGSLADGTITWMANANAVETLIAPRVAAAAAAAGRAAPRVVVGLPVAVHDDVDEAREVAARQFAIYGALPNYQRVLAAGGIDQPAAAAIVGNEGSVRAQVDALFAAGATDVWAAPFPVGDDRAASRARSYALLRDLAVS
ncbi:MAG: TIGR03564 family F420-dependent LLM class oxidoreductase [Acidimicrobiia bacterium]